MKYLIMETHLAYAVALGEDGSFVKAANLHYSTGQIVDSIVPVSIGSAAEKRQNRSTVSRLLRRTLLAAACLAAAVTAGAAYRINLLPYGSVYMSINPDIRLTVNSRDKVIGAEPLDTDGARLLEGYDHRDKDIGAAVNELSDRAVELGYLISGGSIRLELESGYDGWSEEHANTIGTRLSEHLTDEMAVTIELSYQGPLGTDEKVIYPAEGQNNDIGSDVGEAAGAMIPEAETSVIIDEPQTYLIDVPLPETEASATEQASSAAASQAPVKGSDTTFGPSEEQPKETVAAVPETAHAVSIPQTVEPQPAPTQYYEDSDYGDSQYGDRGYGGSAYGNSGYGDSGYGDNDSGTGFGPLAHGYAGDPEYDDSGYGD